VLAIEIGRRAVPGHVRPNFQETEQYCKNQSAAPAGEAAAAA
jgi:hypothetical protein